MISQRREFTRDEVLQWITISVKTIRGKGPAAGRQLSFLDGNSSVGGGGNGDRSCGAGDGSGGDGSVTILRTNVTALLLNPFTIERILLVASPGYLAGCFRPIMTVSTHIVA